MTLNAAQTTSMVNSINSEAARFKDLLSAYRATRAVYQQRLVETMGRVFSNARTKCSATSADGKSVELRLLLSREPPNPRRAAKP